MDWVECLGFMAAFLMFSTFYMKNMIPLRIVGMSSNATFIVYASITHVWPLLVLHTILLPMNFYRFIQMVRLIDKVQTASEQDMAFDFLIPHMKTETFSKDDVVFYQGTHADKIFLVKSGVLSVVEFNVTLTSGELIGEMGVFSKDRKRLATVRCETDVELLSMTGQNIKQLYYQNPEFGFYMIQLLLQRCDQNMLNSVQAGGVDPVEQ